MGNGISSDFFVPVHYGVERGRHDELSVCIDNRVSGINVKANN